MNNLREYLTTGQYAVGSWINTRSTVVAELMAATGFDFLVVDAEHSAVDVPQAQDLFQAIAAGNPDCAPLVRLPGSDYETTKRYMDAGAVGVIAPLVNSASQAVEVVDAVKYPPLGRRGLGFGRSSKYGLEIAREISSANENSFVCVQIEHIDGVENIDEILAVQGVDAVIIGPYDLSASLGIPGELDHLDLIAAQKRILTACETHSIVAGIHVVRPDAQELMDRYREGYRFLAYSLDITMLASVCQSGLRDFRELAANSDTE